MQRKKTPYPLPKKTQLYVLLFFIGFFVTNAQESKWQIDPDHSKIGFSIPYFKIGEIKGTFDAYSGSFTEDITAIQIVINTAFINTNQQKRDEHLKTVIFLEQNSIQK